MKRAKYNWALLSPIILFSGCFAFVEIGRQFKGSTCISPTFALIDDWTVPRAFYDKTQGKRFGFEFHFWNCYFNLRSEGWLEPDGPRTWWAQGALTDLGTGSGNTKTEEFSQALSEETLQFVMMGLASADSEDDESLGYYVYGYNKLRFDWDHDGHWDVEYSWMGRSDFPYMIREIFLPPDAVDHLLGN